MSANCPCIYSQQLLLTIKFGAEIIFNYSYMMKIVCNFRMQRMAFIMVVVSICVCVCVFVDCIQDPIFAGVGSFGLLAVHRQ